MCQHYEKKLKEKVESLHCLPTITMKEYMPLPQKEGVKVVMKDNKNPRIKLDTDNHKGLLQLKESWNLIKVFLYYFLWYNTYPILRHNTSTGTQKRPRVCIIIKHLFF